MKDNIIEKVKEEITFENVLATAMKAPGVKVNRVKQIFADTVASAVPILGGALSGSLTYAMFRPGCMKLRRNLRSYNLCNPEFYKSASEEPDKEVIDVEFVETDSIDNESE